MYYVLRWAEERNETETDEVSIPASLLSNKCLQILWACDK